MFEGRNTSVTPAKNLQSGFGAWTRVGWTRNLNSTCLFRKSRICGSYSQRVFDGVYTPGLVFLVWHTLVNWHCIQCISNCRESKGHVVPKSAAHPWCFAVCGLVNCESISRVKEFSHLEGSWNEQIKPKIFSFTVQVHKTLCRKPNHENCSWNQFFFVFL